MVFFPRFVDAQAIQAEWNDLEKFLPRGKDKLPLGPKGEWAPKPETCYDKSMMSTRLLALDCLLVIKKFFKLVLLHYYMLLNVFICVL